VLDEAIASNGRIFPTAAAAAGGAAGTVAPGGGGAADAVTASMASRPDHTVVIRYVPAVGDSKRALDE
jgi:hypothetical protein